MTNANDDDIKYELSDFGNEEFGINGPELAGSIAKAVAKVGVVIADVFNKNQRALRKEIKDTKREAADALKILNQANAQKNRLRGENKILKENLVVNNAELNALRQIVGKGK